MQSRERTRRSKRRRNGLAVPLALLALVSVGVLVTGMFYSLSREPDVAGTGKPYVGQATAPEAGMGLQESQDSIAVDSLTVLPDTAAVGAVMQPAPRSTDPAVAPSVPHTSTMEALPTPATRDPGFAPASRSGRPHDR